jgi:hypothetical protein
MAAPESAVMSQVQQAAVVSGASYAASWLTVANQVLHLIATVIAIAAGAVALYPVVKRWWTSRQSS